MTNKQMLGATIVASPFIGMYVSGCMLIGFLPITGIFIGTGAFVAIIMIGTKLLVEED